MQEQTLKNVAEFMCAKPHIFTPNGTLGEVIAALVGFDYAAQISADEDDRKQQTSASHVLNWLTSEFSHKGSTPLASLIAGLLERHQTEDAALDAMRKFASSLPDWIN
jgi:hypothetical protein